MSLLQIKNLSVFFRNNNGANWKAVDNVSLKLEKGEILGIVGESGSGKSVTALSILGLLPYPKAYHTKSSSIVFAQKELIGLTDKEFQDIRGNKISFIFQEPMSSLNALHKIGKQIAECIMLHQNLSKTEVQKRVIELLKMVEIPNPEQKINAYPFELSGGQRQRVMIAMAIANNPQILIADEPTTALDVTVQKKIIELLLDLKKRLNMSLIFISHDLRLVHQIADKIAVMYKGKIVETGTAKKVFEQPENDYTKKLIYSSLLLKNNKKTNKISEILSAKSITVDFPIKHNIFGKTTEFLRAVNNVSFALGEGETLGVVGESGSGKTTLAMALVNLVKYKGNFFLANDKLCKANKNIQVVFQDPYNSLNPRMCIKDIILEGLNIHNSDLSKKEKLDKLHSIIKEVGLEDNVLNKYPNEFSGGQRQRIALARSLIIKPQIIVLDEPTSALDVTIQAQIIDLLKEMQKKYKLSYIFISHDMHAIKAISHKIMVMKNGNVVEFGTTESIFKHPKTEYTKELITASLL